MMHDLKLPLLRFTVPEWKPVDLQFFQEQASRLRHVADKAAGTSDAMKRRAIEILRASSNTSLTQQIRTGKDIRALLMLWLHYNKDGKLFREQVKPTQALFERFIEVRPILSKLALHDLAQVYFDHFDHIPELQRLCNFLQAQFNLQQFSGSHNQLALLASNKDTVFRTDAPELIVDRAIRWHITLPDTLSGLGIPGTSGVFQERCTVLYYINSLEKLKLGQDSDLFAELLQDKVLKAPYKNGLLTGHAVLNILIGKTIRAGIPMPENWMKIILTIASDPRVPSSTSSYQTWWQRLDRSYIETVKGWLSRFDLDLFLRAFEAFSKQSGDYDLQRMFPARKRFLEGLHEHGIITKTRLFIGTHAIHFLKQNYDDKELPLYARLTHKDKSIIYMEIAGCHVIEGSHSAKFWVFDRLPAKSNIPNYNKTVFSQSELGAGLKQEYVYEYSRNSKPDAVFVGITHYPNVSWQHKAIKTLEKLGIRLDVEKLLTPEDYRLYKQKFGLAYN